MRDICLLHPFCQSVYLILYWYSPLDAFQSTPYWLWRAVSFLSWAIPMMWGSLKCMFAIWHLLLWWHGLFGFCRLKLVTNHSGTETSWGISFWGVERFHSPKATVSSPQLPTYHKSDNSKTMPRSTLSYCSQASKFPFPPATIATATATQNTLFGDKNFVFHFCSKQHSIMTLSVHVFEGLKSGNIASQWRGEMLDPECPSFNYGSGPG